MGINGSAQTAGAQNRLVTLSRLALHHAICGEVPFTSALVFGVSSAQVLNSVSCIFLLAV